MVNTVHRVEKPCGRPNAASAACWGQGKNFLCSPFLSWHVWP